MTSSFTAAQAYTGLVAQDDTYLRLHATGHLCINQFFDLSSPPPPEAWAAVGVWLCATWTQDSVPSLDNLTGVDPGTLLGFKQCLPTPGPLMAAGNMNSIVWSTPEPLVLTRARRGLVSDAGGPWLNVYLHFSDPFGLMSAFTAFDTTSLARTVVSSQWATHPPA
jgi:hypothetical protein